MSTGREDPKYAYDITVETDTPPPVVELPPQRVVVELHGHRVMSFVRCGEGCTIAHTELFIARTGEKDIKLGPFTRGEMQCLATALQSLADTKYGE